jgi:hypothetical protein
MDDLLWSAKHPAKERGAYDVPVEVICRQSLSDEFRTGEKNKIKANAFKANCSAVDRMFPIMVSLLLSRQEKVITYRSALASVSLPAANVAVCAIKGQK